jgi:hypothetical protein
MLARISTLTIALLGTCFSAAIAGPVTQIPAALHKQDNRHPFIENRGQVVDEKGVSRADILFTLRNANVAIFLSSNSIHYQFEKMDFPEGYEFDSRKVADVEKQEELNKQIKRSTHRMTLSLKGANLSATAIKEEPQAYTENYYLPQCPNGITGLHAYSRITFKDVYPGIDWIIYSDEQGTGITYDFIVHTGADPNKIRMEIKGADEVVIAESGELQLKSRLGVIREHAPVSFSGDEQIDTRFVQTKDGIGFALETYDHNRDLRIDPNVNWASYFGGNGVENAYAVTTDSAGNAFITGHTTSTSQLAVSGYQSTYGGGSSDAFVAKIDSGGHLLWSTYFGGSSDDLFFDCANDRNGDVFCAGHTASSGLATTGAFQTSCFRTDAILVKFSRYGVRQWCTYFGGGSASPTVPWGNEMARSCATDPSGNVYIAGFTNSPGLAYNGFQSSLGSTSANDAFLAKFSSAGALLWSTYLGGSDVDDAYGCTTDLNGNVYICGNTMSTANIASPGAFLSTAFTTTGEGFLVKYDASGNRLWGTYYGNSGGDNATACATDRFGNVFLLGHTTSVSGIATSGTHQSIYNSIGYIVGYNNAYLAKFNSSGQRIWGTYYSGNAALEANGCSADRSGNIYISGETVATTGIASGGMKNSISGQDVFIAKLDSNGNRRWGSYYGGSRDEYGGSCETDRFGNVYLTGLTQSASNIEVNGFQNTLNGTFDAFIVKIEDTITSIKTDTLPNSVLCAGDTLKVGFHSYGYFNPGNICSAELSDTNGSFLLPLTIGTLPATTNIDTVIAVVPKWIPAGTRYRVRIVANLPYTIGEDNGYDITINPAPAQPGAIYGNDSTCTGSTIVYRIAPVPGAKYYIWNLPATWTGSSNGDTITATAGSSGGAISVMAVNACGFSTPSLKAVVSGNFFLTPTVFIPHGIKCKGKANVFYANTTHAGSNPVFQWKKNGVNVGSNNSTYFDSALISGDVISVELTSNADCISQAKVISNNDTVVVGVPTVPGININSFPPIVLCDGTPTQFVSNIVSGGKTPTYQWFKNGVLIPGATASTYTDSLLVNADTLTVALYSSDDCPVTQPTISNHVGVTVYPNLPTAVSITASPDSIANGAPITFTATPVNGGLKPSYIWYLNTIPVPFDTTDTWTAYGLKNGDVVSVRMESSEHCPAPLNAWSAPLMMHSYTTSVTMVANQNGMKVYPNPVNDYLTIEFNKAINDGKLIITDALGRTVFSAKLNGVKSSYDLSGLAVGVYVYRIRIGDEENCFGKILKQ